jgi:rubrerythrin
MIPSFVNILEEIVKNDALHAQWLNTLSMMENTGSRKISAAEHKTKTSLIILKHAAEEARHAYYLKKQIGKLGYDDILKDYDPSTLLCPFESLQYLQRLDLDICRILKNEFRMVGEKLTYGAYLLVTYAIELRAGELYPMYQEVLTTASSKINVRSIITEEETHLEEMLNLMKSFFGNRMLEAAALAQKAEQKYYDQWITALQQELVPDMALGV